MHKDNGDLTFFDCIGCALILSIVLSIIGTISFLLGSFFVSVLLYLSSFFVPILKIIVGLFILFLVLISCFIFCDW